MRFRKVTAGFALAAVIVLTACGGPAKVRNSEGPNKGLVFGEFDTSESDIAVTHVIIKRVDKVMVYRGMGGEKTTHTYVSGRFFAENLDPGKYAVFGLISGNTVYHFEKPKPFTLIPGAIQYAGSYKLRYKKTGLFKFDESSIERRDSKAAENAVLDWLTYQIEGTDWHPRVAARLKKGK